MSEILYNTKYLQLKGTPSKSGKTWVYAHRPNAKDVVVILPVIGDSILFLIEERPPLEAENRAKYSVALPAGLVGDERGDETPEEALKAELLEETGLVADEIKIMSRKIASSPGCVSETVTLAIAYIHDYDVVIPPVNDGGIIIDRVLINRNNVYNWLRKKEEEGFAMTASTLAALYYLSEEK